MDSTEDKLDQAELRKRAALLDLANDAIFVTELDGTITYWNQGAERLYGWTSAEAKGRRRSSFTPRRVSSCAGRAYGCLPEEGPLGRRSHSLS